MRKLYKTTPSPPLHSTPHSLGPMVSTIGDRFMTVVEELCMGNPMFVEELVKLVRSNHRGESRVWNIHTFVKFDSEFSMNLSPNLVRDRQIMYLIFEIFN